MLMKQILRCLAGCSAALLLGVGAARAQAIKTNLPLWLTGSPNIGAEFSLGRQFTINGDVTWMPYMFKKHEEVFRVVVGSVDLRYYIRPKYYYTNNLWDGFYIGPYAMYGDFNVGFYRKDKEHSYRRDGWGVSGGVSLGYKFFLSKRLRMDVNLGVGYAHLQYDKYYLGGEYKHFPLERKITKAWIGPTKFGVHLVYNIFK